MLTWLCSKNFAAANSGINMFTFVFGTVLHKVEVVGSS